MYLDMLTDYNDIVFKINKKYQSKKDKEILGTLQMISFICVCIFCTGVWIIGIDFVRIAGAVMMLFALLLLIGYIIQSYKTAHHRGAHTKMEKQLQKKLRRLLSKRYGIDYREQERMNSLVQFFIEKREQYDLFSFLRHMGIVVSALVTYAGKEYLSKFVQSESDVVVSICYVIIVIAVIALYELWSSMIKSLAKGFLPVKKYDDLISDLKQVYLFSDRDLEADGCDYDKTKGS